MFHYYPSGLDGSIVNVPSSFLKRTFSFSYPAHSALKLSCRSPLMNLSEAAQTYSLWEHLQQIVLYHTLISVWRCRDKQLGLFTTTSCTHTTVFTFLENLPYAYVRGKTKNKILREVSNFFSKTPSHAVTLLLIFYIISPFSRPSLLKFHFWH